METGIERLYLDFDSFFATAEQHFNPALRGRAVGVVPLDTFNTGCIAISREAKALGLRGNASVRDARRLIPDMIFVVARHDVYVRLHRRIIEVIETCLPISQVRSIDEVVCNLLPKEAQEGPALASRIKAALAQSFSEVLTCSIGLAPTELLAKIAAEMDKPDGCVCLSMADLPSRIAHLELTKLPGISESMAARLKKSGVEDVPALWNLAPKQARAIWGSVEGERFWNELHGLHTKRPPTAKRMFGHSRMLPLDWRTHEMIEVCARQLATSAARRLRRADLRATRLTLSFRGGGYRDSTGSRQDDQKWVWEKQCLPACDDHTFLSLLSEGLARSARGMQFRPRSVSVMLHGLADDSMITGDLFGAFQHDAGQESVDAHQARWEQVSEVMDKLCARHGPAIISMGPRREVPGGYLGAKIAFGRIPDDADFSNAPVTDGATHFCTLR
jgi:DNA polymerase-4